LFLLVKVGSIEINNKGGIKLQAEAQEKSNLAENLSLTESLVTKYVENQKEINHYYEKPMSFPIWLHIIFGLIGYGIFGNLLLIIFLAFNIGAPLNYVSIVIGALIYPIGYNVLNSKLREKKISKNKDQIEELNKHNKTTISKLEEKSIIPEDYWSKEALSHFKKYIQNQRADTLKEAINLYEQEQHQNRQMNEIRLTQYHAEQARNKANEASILGWLNFFRR